LLKSEREYSLHTNICGCKIPKEKEEDEMCWLGVWLMVVVVVIQLHIILI